MSYVTGKIIKELRGKKRMTQKQLAEIIKVSDKTISKWETDRGLPDIALIGTLAESLNVSVAELLAGEYVVNANIAANMKKINFYVCPVCGNVIVSTGKGSYCCCGITLPVTQDEDSDTEHEIFSEILDNEYYIHMNHSMEKEHYISFLAYVTSEKVELVKMYPEQNIECRFARKGHGYIYAYCNRHGLFRLTL